MALWMAVVVAPVQALIGDMHGLNTLKHRRSKLPRLRALGKYARRANAAYSTMSWPDMEPERTAMRLNPALGSLI